MFVHQVTWLSSMSIVYYKYKYMRDGRITISNGYLIISVFKTLKVPSNKNIN